jgi:hypothetical protein
MLTEACYVHQSAYADRSCVYPTSFEIHMTLTLPYPSGCIVGVKDNGNIASGEAIGNHRNAFTAVVYVYAVPQLRDRNNHRQQLCQWGPFDAKLLDHLDQKLHK